MQATAATTTGADPAAPRDGVPGAAGSPPNRDGRARRWLLAFVLLALVPVVGAAVRMHLAGWLPEGDDAMIARRTMAVFTTAPPLTGQPSTAGGLFTKEGSAAAASIDASHPGPLEYWVLAVPYRLSGWSPTGLLVGVALVNGASAALVVWLAWRRLGAPGAAAGCVAVLVVAQQLGSFHLARPLNATIVILPLLAGLVATWAVLAGDRMAVVPAAACLSFACQCTLAAAPLAGTALLGVLGVGAWRWWQGPRDRTFARLPLALAGVLVLAWCLVVAEQLSGHPGNLSRLWSVSRLSVDRAGLPFGLTAVADHVVQASWPGSTVLPRISILGPLSTMAAVLKGLGVVLAAVAALAWARHRRQQPLTALVALVLGTSAVAALVLANGPDEVPFGPEYLLTWLVPLSALLAFTVVVVVADVAAHLLARTRAACPRAGRVGLVVAGVVTVAALGTAVAGGPLDRADNARTARLGQEIRRRLPPGTYRLSATGSYAYLSTLDALSVDLLAHGYDIRVVRFGTIPDEPRYRDTEVDAPTIAIDSNPEPGEAGTLLAEEGPLPHDLSWAGGLLAAVEDPGADLTVVGAPDPPPTTQPCTATALDLADRAAAAEGAEAAAHRRSLALAVLACPQPQRRLILAQVRFSGVDRFWLDLLASTMPAPYPRTGITVRLLPAGT